MSENDVEQNCCQFFSNLSRYADEDPSERFVKDVMSRVSPVHTSTTVLSRVWRWTPQVGGLAFAALLLVLPPPHPTVVDADQVLLADFGGGDTEEFIASSDYTVGDLLGIEMEEV